MNYHIMTDEFPKSKMNAQVLSQHCLNNESSFVLICYWNASSNNNTHLVCKLTQIRDGGWLSL